MGERWESPRGYFSGPEVFREERGTFSIRFFSIDRTHNADFIPLADLSRFLGVSMQVVKRWYEEGLITPRTHIEGCWQIKGVDIDELDRLQFKMQEAAKIIYRMNQDEIEAIRLRRVWNLNLKADFIEWRKTRGKSPQPLRGIIFEPLDSNDYPVRNFWVHQDSLPHLANFFFHAEAAYRKFFKLLIRFARLKMKTVLKSGSYRAYCMPHLILDPPEYTRPLYEYLTSDYYNKRMTKFLLTKGRIRPKILHPEVEMCIAQDAWSMLAGEPLYIVAGMNHLDMQCPSEIPLGAHGYILKEYVPLSSIAPVPEPLLFAAVQMQRHSEYNMNVTERNFDVLDISGIRAVHWHFGEEPDFSRLHTRPESKLTPRRRELLPMHRYMMMKDAAKRKKIVIGGKPKNDFQSPTPEMQMIMEYADFTEDEFMSKYNEIDKSLQYVEIGTLIEQIEGKPRMQWNQTIFAYEQKFTRETSGGVIKRRFNAWLSRPSGAPAHIISLRRADTFGP